MWWQTLVLCNSQCSHSDATRHAEWWRSLLPSTAHLFMYCRRLAVYRTNLETFWYTLVYTLIITQEFRLLCIPLTLISILEDRGPANNAGYNHLPEEFGSLCIRLFPCNSHWDLYIYIYIYIYIYTLLILTVNIGKLRRLRWAGNVGGNRGMQKWPLFSTTYVVIYPTE